MEPPLPPMYWPCAPSQNDWRPADWLLAAKQHLKTRGNTAKVRTIKDGAIFQKTFPRSKLHTVIISGLSSYLDYHLACAVIIMNHMTNHIQPCTPKMHGKSLRDVSPKAWLVYNSFKRNGRLWQIWVRNSTCHFSVTPLPWKEHRGRFCCYRWHADRWKLLLLPTWEKQRSIQQCTSLNWTACPL